MTLSQHSNHDIYKHDLESSDITRLTDHPNTETYPRISPNGRSLVFSRAHQVWVSQRNLVAWDVFLLDLDTGLERKISSNSTAPAWINDREITVLREGHIVEKVNVNTSN